MCTDCHDDGRLDVATSQLLVTSSVPSLTCDSRFTANTPSAAVTTRTMANAATTLVRIVRLADQFMCSPLNDVVLRWAHRPAGHDGPAM